MSKFKFLAVFLSVLFLLAACASGGGNSTPTPPQGSAGQTTTGPVTQATAPGVPNTGGSQATGLPATGSTPAASTGSSGSFVPAPIVTPASGLHAAQIVPENERGQATLLSTWMNYQVVDRDGKPVGTISDYILNMCESHILHMVVKADPSLGLKNGDTLVIPYEVVALAGGQIDISHKAIVLNAHRADLANAPAFKGTPDLTNTSWEQSVMGFWSKYTSFSLTSRCTSPTVNSNKLGLASKVLKADLQDFNGKSLAKVQDAVLEPESGTLQFFVLQLDPSLQSGQGYTLAPVGAINVRDKDAGALGAILSSTVATNVLTGAPKVASVPKSNDTAWLTPQINYWSKYVQVTKPPD